jgi:hypothetical protein
VYVKEPSNAVNAGMAKQTEGRLRPQLELWHGLEEQELLPC